LIQRGVLPSDPRLANERSNCQKQSERQEPQPIGSRRSVYAVSGVALGTTVPLGSSGYREYECSPSDQLDGFTWCQKTRKEKERRGKFNATYSILHSRDGAAVYVNRYQEPAFFGANEADNDIQQYSRKIGEPPRITRMPHRAGFPTGILASWGKVELEPLDDDNIKALAEGRRPTTKGYFIDFIGNSDSAVVMISPTTGKSPISASRPKRTPVPGMTSAVSSRVGVAPIQFRPHHRIRD
jgi:hypothetical protein